MATGRPVPTPRPRKDRPRWLLVRDFPENISSETITYYFESRAKFGRELYVEDVKLNIEENWAVVTFKDAADARVVVQTHSSQPCVIDGRTLSIELFDGDIKKIVKPEKQPTEKPEKRGTESRTTHETIEVSGFGDLSSEESLRYYFENTRRSGGGALQMYKLDKEIGCLYLQFEDSTVTDKVLHRRHEVENCTLILRKVEMSPKEFVFSDFAEDMSEDLLTNFLEARLKVKIEAVFMHREINKALVQFSEQTDFNKVSITCQKETINGIHLTPHPVPVTSTIKVTNLPDVEPETVEKYFENKYVSNGGEIQKVKFYADQGYCLLSFKDKEVVQKVCRKKDHKLCGELVEVEPYLEILQPPKCAMTKKIPDPIKLISDDGNKEKFVKRCDKKRCEFKEILEKANARILWDETPPLVECSLDQSNISDRKLLNSWEENTRSVIDKYFNDVVVKTKEVEASMLMKAVEALNNVVIPDPQVVATFIDKTNSTITVVACKTEFDVPWNKICMAIEEVEERIRQEKAIITEEKNLKHWQFLYTKNCGLLEDIKETHITIKIDLSEKKGNRVIFVGAKESVRSAIDDMLKRLRKICYREIDLNSRTVELLQNSCVHEHIKEAFIEQDLPDSYVISDKYTMLFAFNEDDLDKMETCFTDIFCLVKIPIDAKKADLLKSQGWDRRKRSLIREHDGCMVITITNKHLEVFTLSDRQDEIAKDLQEFLSENAVYSNTMTVSPYVIKYIEKVERRRYDHEIQSLSCKIDLSDKGVVKIEGTSTAIKAAKEIINKFERSITIQKHQIKHLKVNEYFTSVKGKECLLKVQDSIPCIIHVRNDAKSQDGSSTDERFEKLVCCAEVTHSSGVKLEVFGGDIISINPDVLVNPANKHLEHNGGLANIIVRKGGRRIANECKDHIAANGPLSEGDIFVSEAGKLQSKFVVHAVGPRWTGGGQGEANRLKKAVIGCLKSASERNMKTIALPALCTGKFGYPSPLACLAITEAVDTYLQQQSGSLQKVFFCDISVSTVKAFANALKKIFEDIKYHDELKADGVPKDCCKFGNVNVSVINGLLTKESVNVIVNSTAKSLKLNTGRSSAAVLKAAGDAIQQECQQKHPDGIDYGQVAVTTGGKLRCSNIFHVAIDKYDSNNSTACFQQIDQCVTSCLQEASKLGHKSISFPAMGTGLQKYPKKEVAKQIIQSTQNFCTQVPGTSLQAIHFVIFTGEDNTYEVFLKELMRYQSSDGSATQSMDTDDGDFCNVTVYAKNKDDARKAVRQLDETVKKEWKIKKIDDGNIHKLNDGDIRKLKAMANSKGVDITVDTDIGSVTIVGVDVNVLEITQVITERLRSIEKWDGKKEKAGLMATVIQWSYVNNTNNQVCKFSDLTNLDIENAYQQKQKTVKIKDGKKVEYEITFATMTEVEVNNPGNMFQVKRQDLKAASSVSVPNFWQPMAANEVLAMVPLAAGSAEYQKVVTDFQRTLGRVPNILKIERVQNKILYAQYLTKRLQIDHNTPNFERILWHGTAQTTIPIINLNGFNRSYSNSGLKGVYFAVNASYSDGGYARPGNDGYKRMYRCTVLTGKVSLASGTSAPPPINPAVPHVLYDSVSDNPANPVMFIIFNDTQAYPEHLITYQ